MIIFSNLINVDNIILQKELKHNNNLIFIPIQYKYDSIKKEKESYKKEPFVFQINNLYCKFGLNVYSEYKKSVDLYLKDDIKHQKTIEIFNDIFLKVKKLYNNDYVEHLLKNYANDKFMRCKVHYFSKIYSTNKEKLNIDDLKSRIFCDCILQLQGIWIYKNSSDYKNKPIKNKIWFEINLIQARLHIPICMKEYAFIDDIKHTNTIDDIDDIDDNKKTIEFKTDDLDYDKYAKFRDMIKKGIPKPAVIFQMGIEGIVYSDDILKSSKQNISNKSYSKMDLNNSIKNMNLKHILKKPSFTHDKKELNTKLKMGFEPPSINVLQNALRNLNKVNKDR